MQNKVNFHCFLIVIIGDIMHSIIGDQLEQDSLKYVPLFVEVQRNECS